jgi:hypothetical protein
MIDFLSFTNMDAPGFVFAVETVTVTMREIIGVNVKAC